MLTKDSNRGENPWPLGLPFKVIQFSIVLTEYSYSVILRDLESKCRGGMQSRWQGLLLIEQSLEQDLGSKKRIQKQYTVPPPSRNNFFPLQGSCCRQAS